MKTWIIVKPNVKKESIEILADGSLRVCVHAPATEGKANDAVIKLLSKHFRVSKSAVKILTGINGRKKLIEIIEKV